MKELIFLVVILDVIELSRLLMAIGSRIKRKRYKKYDT